MKRLFIILLLITSPAYAGMPVCFDGSGNITSSSLSSSPKTGCLYFSDSDITKYNAARTLLTTVQKKHLKVVSNNLVELTVSEKSILAGQELISSNAARAANIDSLKVTASDAFVAFIKVYNSKVPISERITKSELIGQIKTDKGL